MSRSKLNPFLPPLHAIVFNYLVRALDPPPPPNTTTTLRLCLCPLLNLILSFLNLGCTGFTQFARPDDLLARQTVNHPPTDPQRARPRLSTLYEIRTRPRSLVLRLRSAC
jgi:hypothetical protein